MSIYHIPLPQAGQKVGGRRDPLSFKALIQFKTSIGKISGHWEVVLITEEKGECTRTAKFIAVDCSQDFQKISLEWGGRRLVVPDWRWYLQYFSWESWANEQLLEQLPKKVAEGDGFRAASEVAKAVFRRHPSIKSLKYLMRYFLRRQFRSSDSDRK